jgi:hypothetical protein
MTAQGDFTDYSYGERRGFLRMHSKQGNERIGYYQMGEFLHPNGIVTVYQQDDFTRMDFMHGDRLHTRQWDREWGAEPFHVSPVNLSKTSSRVCLNDWFACCRSDCGFSSRLPRSTWYCSR